MTMRTAAVAGLVLLLLAPAQAAVATGGSGITTTRPISDPSFGVRSEETVSTTRPLSDASFDPLPGTPRPATAESSAPREFRANAFPVVLWGLVGLVALAVAGSLVVARQRHTMDAT
jgi:hypothetical protein